MRTVNIFKWCDVCERGLFMSSFWDIGYILAQVLWMLSVQESYHINEWNFSDIDCWMKFEKHPGTKGYADM